MIDPEIIERILRTWDEDQEHPGRGRTRRVLPGREVVHAFIEGAFFASLEREEGKAASFSLALMSRAEAVAQPSLSVQTLTEPILLAPVSLAKIAPAFDPRLNTLAVHPSAGDDLVIWGVFTHSPPKHRLNEVPAGIPGRQFSRPDCLTVTASAPGSLAFSRGNNALGRIAGGEFVRATPSLFTHHSLGLYWDELLKKTNSWLPERISYWHHARDFLEILLKEIALRGNGGTLVILDQAEAAPVEFYEPKYILESNLDLGVYLKEAAQGGSGGSVINQMFRKLAHEAMQRTAQLAAIDGALIIDSNFKVVTFGAKLKAPPWAGRTRLGPDGWGQTVDGEFDLRRYGMRHRSGRDFAGACARAIVFVVSQDGPVRAFHRTGPSDVRCWPNCDTSMFVD